MWLIVKIFFLWYQNGANNTHILQSIWYISNRHTHTHAFGLCVFRLITIITIVSFRFVSFWFYSQWESSPFHQNETSIRTNYQPLNKWSSKSKTVNLKFFIFEPKIRKIYPKEKKKESLIFDLEKNKMEWERESKRRNLMK